MNYNIACNILNLKPNFTYNELRKNYHILALQYHPDKNISEDASDVFKKINNAYDFLNNYLKDKNINTNEYDINSDECLPSYMNLISNFIKLLNLSKNESDKIINMFKNTCLEYIISSINSLEINTIVLISYYFNLYHNFFNISSESIEIIKETINNKLQSTNNYILNPTIDNLFNNDIYCLEHNNDIIYIPLWHKELQYDTINIKCIPLLNENITIDENNNIHYKIFINIEKIFTLNKLYIELSSNKYFIPVEKLYIKNYQIYTLYKCGISKINKNNILDIDNKSNIIVHIFIQ